MRVHFFTVIYFKYKASIIVFDVDPHVRIAGLPEDVKTAKMQVMSVLDDRVRIFISFSINFRMLKFFFN